MKKILKISAIVVSIIGILLMLASGIVAYLIGTPSGQRHIKSWALGHVQQTLQTDVAIDSINFSLARQTLEFYGMHVADRQGHPMLDVDTLTGAMDVMQLLDNVISIHDIRLYGMHADIYRQHPDSAANDQFVIDAFSSKGKENGVGQDGGRVKARKQKFVADITDVRLRNIDAKYELHDVLPLSVKAHLGQARYHDLQDDIDIRDLQSIVNSDTSRIEHVVCNVTTERGYMENVRLSYLDYDLIISRADGDLNQRTMKSLTMRGITAEAPNTHVTIASIAATQTGTRRRLRMDSVAVVTDNGRPSANHGNPRRGAFDAGHLNIHGRADITVLNADKQSASIVVNNITATDRTSGIRIDSLSLAATTADMRTAHISNLYLRSQHTTARIASADVTIPSAKQRREFAFRNAHVLATVVLKDLAQPFAPALNRFTTPLQLSTVCSGNASKLDFSDVCISTRDRRLLLSAHGNITGLKATGGQRHASTRIFFTVDKMTACRGIKEQIIAHFANKHSLMGLLRGAGDVGYRGTVDIGKGYEAFRGTLTTDVGTITTALRLDEKTKYMMGTATTDAFDVGRMIGNRSLEKVALDARFKFDIAGRSAAQRLGRPFGKLPRGSVSGKIKEVKYDASVKLIGKLKIDKQLTFRNVDYKLESNGTKAVGSIDMNRNLIDVNVDFTLTGTDFKHDLSIRPHVRLHKKNKNRDKDE